MRVKSRGGKELFSSFRNAGAKAVKSVSFPTNHPVPHFLLKPAIYLKVKGAFLPMTVSTMQNTLCPAQHQDICLRVVFWSPLPTQPVSYFREKHLFSLDSMVIVRSYMGFLSRIPSSSLWNKAFLYAITKSLGFPLVALNLTLEYG